MALPRLIEESDRSPGQKIWTCKIGEVDVAELADGADFPMREAIRTAYRSVAGIEPKFLFSGWGGHLTKYERTVAENKS
jgi:hypothetical protein